MRYLQILGIRRFHIYQKPEFFRQFCNNDKCEYCKGNQLVCRLCKGIGKTYFDGCKEHICNNCNGCGIVQCDICGGSGRNHNIF